MRDRSGTRRWAGAVLGLALSIGLTARAERAGSDWSEVVLRRGAEAVEVGSGLWLAVAPEGGEGAGPARVRLIEPPRRGSIHPDLEPLGRALEIGPGTRVAADIAAEVPSGQPAEGRRLVFAVEMLREHRLGRFEPTVALPTLTPGRETSAWVLADASAVEGAPRVSARVGLVEGRRLLLASVPERLAPPAPAVPVAVGARDVSLCVGRRGAVLELATGERAAVAPSRTDAGRARECDAMVLRRVAPDYTPALPRRAFTPAGPTLALEGLAVASLLDSGRVTLTVPLEGRPPAGRRLVVALERIENRGDCFGGHGGAGCEVAWSATGHLLVEAHLDESGRAHARLPVSAQAGLREGRLRFGFIAAATEGVEVLPAPSRRPR